MSGPAVVLVDANGHIIAVTTGSTIYGGVPAMGKDPTQAARFVAVNPSGEVLITASGSLPVTVSGGTFTTTGTLPVAVVNTPSVNATVVNTVPISGQVTANAGTGSFSITSTGSIPVNVVAGQIAITSTGTLSVFALGEAITGSFISGSFGFPAMGMDPNSKARFFSVDTNGQQNITTTGSLPVAILNTPSVNATIIGIVPVSGQVTANAGTGSFSITSTGSLPVNVIAGQVAVTSTGSLAVAILNTPSVNATVVNTVPVSGQVTANAGTGSFSITSTGSIPTFITNQVSVTSTGTLSIFALGEATTGSFISGSFGFPTMGMDQNSKARFFSVDTNGQQNITTTGSLPVSIVAGSVSITSTGSLPVSIIGIVPVSGQVTANAGTGSFAITSTGSLPVNIVAGQVSVTSTGSLAVSILNTPSVNATVVNTVPVSGQITANAGTGSFAITSTGSIPVNVVAGQVFVTSTGTLSVFNLGEVVTGSFISGSFGFPAMGMDSNSKARFFSTDVNGQQNITTTGSLPVSIVAGSVSVTSTGTLPVSIIGTVPVTVGNTVPVSGQVTVNAGTGSFAITSTGSIPVTVVAGQIAVTSTGTLSVFNLGEVITGSLISGSYGFPAMGIDSNSRARFFSVDTNGQQNITTTGSLPVSIVSNSTSPANLSTTGSIAGSTAALVAGTDSNNILRGLKTNSTGELFITLTGSVSTVVSNQVSITTTGSLPVNIVAGSITANNNSVSTTGSASPGSATLVAGNDSNNRLRGMFVDAGGAQYVTTSGSLPVTVVAGSISGSFSAVEASVSATGSASPGYATLVAGNDTNNRLRGMSVDIGGAQFVTTSGSLPVTIVAGGSSATNVSNTGSAGPPTTANVGGVDNNTVLRGFRTDTNGFQQVTASISNTRITGSFITGSLGFPAMGIDSTGAARFFSTDVNGQQNITTTGSLPVTIVAGGSSANNVSNTGSAAPAQAAFVGGADSNKVLRGLLTDTGGAQVITSTGSLPTVPRAIATTSTGTNISGSVSSVQFLPSNTSRLMATFFNDSTALCYLKWGTPASVTEYAVQMPAYSYYELPWPVYTGRVDGIWAVATGSMRITELT